MIRLIVAPKFKVGERVNHGSCPDKILVISEMLHEKKRVPTVFGNSVYVETRDSYFNGSYICEWIDHGGKHTDVFDQNTLELVQ